MNKGTTFQDFLNGLAGEGGGRRREWGGSLMEIMPASTSNSGLCIMGVVKKADTTNLCMSVVKKADANANCRGHLHLLNT